MTQRELFVPVEETTLKLIAEVLKFDEQRRTTPPGSSKLARSPEHWLFLVFRRTAADWVDPLENLEARGHVRLPGIPGKPTLINASDVRFTENFAATGEEERCARLLVPDRMYETLRRGVNLQRVLNERMHVQPSWSTPQQWLREVALEAAIAAHAAHVKALVETEGDDLTYYGAPETGTTTSR